MRLLLAALNLLIPVLVATTPVVAQVAAPPGWTREVRPDGIAFTSPGAGETTRVAMFILPRDIFEGAFAIWYETRIAIVELSLGGGAKRSGAVRQGEALVETLGQSAGEGRARRAVVLGYEVGRSGQLITVLIPEGIADEDPRVEAALALARDLAAKRFLLVPSLLGKADAKSERRPQR